MLSRFAFDRQSQSASKGHGLCPLLENSNRPLAIVVRGLGQRGPKSVVGVVTTDAGILHSQVQRGVVLQLEAAAHGIDRTLLRNVGGVVVVRAGHQLCIAAADMPQRITPTVVGGQTVAAVCVGKVAPLLQRVTNCARIGRDIGAVPDGRGVAAPDVQVLAAELIASDGAARARASHRDAEQRHDAFVAFSGEAGHHHADGQGQRQDQR